MDELDVHTILVELVELAEDFLDRLTGEEGLTELDAEEVFHFLEERRGWFDALEGAAALEDPETIGVCQRLLELDKAIDGRLRQKKVDFQSELSNLRQNRKGLQGYQCKPLRGRRTLEAKG